MDNDPVARAQRLLPMFTRPSLLKALCEETIKARAEAEYWQERALEVQERALQMNAAMVSAQEQVERLMAPAPRRFLLAKLWGRA